MVVSLPPDVEEFIEKELASERYKSREELLAQAVRWLRDRAADPSLKVDWFEQALEQFCAMLRLPRGWDSNHAEPPDPKLVHTAANLLYRLSQCAAFPKPHINPTRRGGVQLEWENGPRSFELEVGGVDCVTYFFQDEAAGLEQGGEFSPHDRLEIVADYIRCAGNSSSP